ncbi:uncharacterized protein [Dysidea avara]|uniref:uncharacterized protein n=1 Tax=Dysidea avara TaxID=196820 RepID=UPI003321D099
MLSLRAWWSNKVSEPQDKGPEQTTRPLKKKSRSLKNFPKIIHKRKSGSSCSSSVTEHRHTDKTSDVEKKQQRQQQQQQEREEKQETVTCTVAVKQQDVTPAPLCIITETRTLDSVVESVSKEQDNSPAHTAQSDSKQQDESDANMSLESEEPISESTVKLVESANNSPTHSARLHSILFDDRSLKILKEAEDILSTLASRNRSSQERVSAKRLYWETKAKREGYKDPKWNVTKDEWAKLQLYHYNQEAAVTQILENLQLLQS